MPTTLDQLRQSTPRANQQPFARVAPVLRAALLLGAGGGFALALVLTTALAFNAITGPWWMATVQAHGHLQLFGWAGLFIVGVALHFLPRLHGTPLAWPRLVPWALGSLVAGLVARGIAQPLVAASGAGIWRVALVASGVGELVGVALLLALLAATERRPPRGQNLARRQTPAIAPLVIGAGVSLALATLVNVANLIAAARSPFGLVPAAGDDVSVLLGEFGLLVPMALAMSAQTLPLYAGLTAFPRALLRALASLYLLGLALATLGTWREATVAAWPSRLIGLGFALIGGVVVAFVVVFARMLRARGQLPAKVAALAPDPAAAARGYRQHIARQRDDFGPFVPLVASAYLWALIAGALAVLLGLGLVVTGHAPLPLDAVRHGFAVGFIALLICGIATRMIPGFSGGHIRDPRLVWATLWLGNAAALLRVGAILLATPLGASAGGQQVDALLFGLAGPVGLALAICLVVNLWPALASAPHHSGS